ncbi:MAG TPA: MlaD family protein [bacterium]|nr:MlaD family protein [bacterium]
MDEQHQLKVGITVIVGFILLAAIIFMVSDFHLLTPGSTFFVTFNFANGLAEGAPVMVAGVEVGTVEAIDFVTDNQGNTRVQLTVWVNRRARVFRNSKAFINTLGLMGEKYLEITTGEGGEQPIREGDVLAGTDPIRQDEILSRGAELVREFQSSVAAVNSILGEAGTRDDIRNTLHNMNNISRRIDSIIEKNEGSINTSLANFGQASTRLNSTVQTFDRMITGNEKGLTESIQNFSTGIGELRLMVSENRPGLTRAVQDFQTFSGDLAALTHGNRATLGTTITNVGEASGNLKGVLEKMDAVLTRINSTQGTLGMLLNDATVGNNLRKSSQDLREMIAYVKYRPWLLYRSSDEPLRYGTEEP